jgi:hypothetical protein
LAAQGTQFYLNFVPHTADRLSHTNEHVSIEQCGNRLRFHTLLSLFLPQGEARGNDLTMPQDHPDFLRVAPTASQNLLAREDGQVRLGNHGLVPAKCRPARLPFSIPHHTAFSQSLARRTTEDRVIRRKQPSWRNLLGN